MKIIKGIDQGREALSRHLLTDDQNKSPEITDSIEKIFGEKLTVEQAVRKIVSEVSESGDQAVNDYSKRIDGSEAVAVEVNRDDMDRYVSEIPRDTLDAMAKSARRVREFNASSLPRPWVDLERGFGEMIVPIERLGIYIPGGSGSYPSTVLMTAIPARVAGVKEIFLCTPPRRDGSLNPLVVAAAMMADVTKIFTIGGAQAIAAMAYGTESVPKVDMICGPGNIFVTTAKRMVFGEVNIDGLEGPTETLLIADESAELKVVPRTVIESNTMLPVPDVVSVKSAFEGATKFVIEISPSAPNSIAVPAAFTFNTCPAEPKDDKPVPPNAYPIVSPD